MKLESLPDVLKAVDISKYVGISKGKAYELMRIEEEAGGLPVVRIGRNVRVMKSDLMNWLENQKEA